MYSQEIYGSWSGIQEEKYAEMMRLIGKRNFQEIFSPLALDIGCNNSGFLAFLTANGIEANMIGIDVICGTGRGFQVVVGDGDALPFRDEAFGAVVCIDTAHRLATNDFSRVLKNGGIVLFAIFFNDGNYEERKNMLAEKLAGFETLREFELDLREKEYVVLARKK